MADVIRVEVTLDPEKGSLSIVSNLKHPVETARLLAAALNATLAPQQPQSRIIAPHPSGLAIVGGNGRLG